MKFTIKIPKWLLVMLAIVLVLLVIYGVEQLVGHYKTDCCP